MRRIADSFRRAIAIFVASLLLVHPALAGQERIANYRDTLSLFWGEVYEDGGETLYCGVRFGPEKGPDINVEHILPMSWVMNALDCDTRDQCRRDSDRFNRIEADLHNLYPSRKDVNKARGSFPFGDVRGEYREFPECDFEVDRRRRLVEPRPASRGEIARAMFYMHETYDLDIHTRLGKLLKRWYREDPPGAGEEHRNDVIEQLQGTRNRFIDEPEAAYRLWF
ncbi:MAG: endonuclease [Pseudomonadota bacterium]|nr:endonuclease [Pseudomonadota bacterium]